jgi:hypothetical protein
LSQPRQAGEVPGGKPSNDHTQQKSCGLRFFSSPQARPDIKPLQTSIKSPTDDRRSQDPVV